MSKESLKLQEDRDDTIPRSTKELIIFMVRPYAKKTFLFFFLTLLGVLAWTATPVVVSAAVTSLSKSQGVSEAVWWLVAAYIALRVVDEVFWRSSEWLMSTFKPQMIERLRTHLFAATLRRPYSYFVNSSSGRIGHWINQAVSTMNELVDVTIWTVWSRVVGLIFAAVFLFLSHWSLALLFIFWLIALFAYNAHRGKKFSELVALQSDESSRASGMVVDSVSNHLSVRVFNAARREESRLVTQQNVIVRRWRDSWRQNLVTNTVKGGSAAIISIIALIQVIFLYSQGIVQLGDIVLFLAYFGDASTSLWQLAWALDSYFRQFGTVQNSLDGLQGENERYVNKDKPTNTKNVELELRKVNFAYSEQPEVKILSALDLTIKKGEKVGIVGHSGAGKSTLIGLLLGFYEPTDGSILLNGEDVTMHDPSYIRSVSSFVPQDTNLFNRTVRENVLYARPDATEEKLMEALKQAQAYAFVQKLPDELETVIGERGVKLSGGQRQRLAIARAILQDAPLLILDEATSALDSVSEQAIQRALHELMKDRTSIVVAHRLSTLKHLDKIVVLDGGRCVEQGSHDELLENNGIYADLWARQKDGFIVD